VHKQRFYLKEWREERELSQAKLAARTDTGETRVDIRTIQNIENEPYSIRQGRVIRALEKALDLPAGGLKQPPDQAQRVEQEANLDFEERMKGRVTIEIDGEEIELT
jgi:transcriptional regulator with XRE-family HTH domain